jgi:uncharacterized protein (TIGR00369 family)
MEPSAQALQAFFDYLTDLYTHRLPFNRVLGLSVVSLSAAMARLTFDIQPKLVGNPVQRILHGGVISAVLDATGGLTATAGMADRLCANPAERLADAVARVGTIDLRVDYLRPGRGRTFTATGSVMRAGKRVAVTRMELHNEDALLIAVGTGTYMVGS